PGGFWEDPTVILDSYIAGSEGGVTLNFTTWNPVPNSGHIVIIFPGNFSGVYVTKSVFVEGMNGGLNTSIGDGSHTVVLERDGSGTDTPGHTHVSLRLEDGVRNQRYEGYSTVFPVVKTTMANINFTIDEASSQVDSAMDPVPPIFFVAAAFPNIRSRLQYKVAGIGTNITFFFSLTNPLPADGLMVVDFPGSFTEATPTVAESSLDGTLIASGSFSVILERNDTGNVALAGTKVVVTLNRVFNREQTGESGNFTLTTYTDRSMVHR
ncbi:unnamed protein product, partial [Choristocarpus tenellus]